MQRYFVEGNINAFSFSDNDIFHITKVMRMKENDNIEVVCNQKCYLCKIININPFQIDVIDELKEDINKIEENYKSLLERVERLENS